jgi:hypothetical protein
MAPRRPIQQLMLIFHALHFRDHALAELAVAFFR